MFKYWVLYNEMEKGFTNFNDKKRVKSKPDLYQ